MTPWQRGIWLNACWVFGSMLMLLGCGEAIIAIDASQMILPRIEAWKFAAMLAGFLLLTGAGFLIAIPLLHRGGKRETR